ncbi:MAG: hypothetical protein RR133_04265 [Kiritimatiellia bacterium]
MKSLISFLVLLCALPLSAQKALIVAAIETADERAESLFITAPMPKAEDWEAEGKLLLAQFARMERHQQEVYDRYAKSDRGRALLLARDTFIAQLTPLVKGKATVKPLSQQLPSSADVALIRLVIADPELVSEENGGMVQTVRTQKVIVSVEDLSGNVNVIVPETCRTVLRSTLTTKVATFDAALLEKTLQQAAQRLADELYGDKKVAQVSTHTYEIGAAIWEVGTARVEVATLMSQAIAPSSSYLLAGLQPTKAYTVSVKAQPLEGTLLGMGSVTIGGETSENNCALLRSALLPAFKEQGVHAVLRGAQGDTLRMAQGVTLPDRKIELKMLTYQEVLSYDATPVAVAEIPIHGQLSVRILVTVKDRQTGDILSTKPVTFSCQTEAVLNEANPMTYPFDVSMAMELLAKRVAETMKTLED